MSDDDRFDDAADAEHLIGEAEQRDAFLDQITDDPVMRRALARDPAVLGWLARIDAASDDFIADPNARNHARALARAVLEAAGGFAGSLGAAAAGKASGAARQADEDTLERDALIRDLWAATDPNAFDSTRADIVMKRLWKEHHIEISTRTILRVVKKS
jgi:hypothetical protein